MRPLNIDRCDERNEFLSPAEGSSVARTPRLAFEGRSVPGHEQGHELPGLFPGSDTKMARFHRQVLDVLEENQTADARADAPAVGQSHRDAHVLIVRDFSAQLCEERLKDAEIV